MSDDPWTVMRLLQWTTDFFRARGSESPRLDAEILLAHARDCQRIELYTQFGEVPGDEQRIAFRELVKRRGDGAPVAQLVGFKEFYSVPLRVNEHVLIPRPETEHLVVEAIDRIKSLTSPNRPGISGGPETSGGPVQNRPCQILDVGTGSGAIAIAIAKNSPVAKLTAVDVSLPALEIAAWNVDKQDCGDRVKLLQSDLFSGIDPKAKFDIVCSNPPYISEAEYNELPVTVRQFEPKSALLSAPDGTEMIAKLIEQSPRFLQPHGWLIVELSPMIAGAVRTMVEENPSWAEPKLIRDLAGHQRILSVQRSAKPA